MNASRLSGKHLATYACATFSLVSRGHSGFWHFVHNRLYIYDRCAQIGLPDFSPQIPAGSINGFVSHSALTLIRSTNTFSEYIRIIYQTSGCTSFSRNFLNLGPSSILSRRSGSFGTGEVYDEVRQYRPRYDFGERPFAQKLCKLLVG